MKNLCTIIFILFILSGLNCKKVELFDESLCVFQNYRDFCISKNNREAYFTIQSPNRDLSQIVCMKKENGEWLKPRLVEFCDEYRYLEPFLTIDNKRLFFVSDRPINDTLSIKKDFDIWYVKRANVNDKWSTPINIGSIVNSELDEFYPTLSRDNNLYFTMKSKEGLGKDDIYFCKWNGNEYSKPVLLNENINSEGYEFNAYISKDESFLIYTKYNTKNGFGSGDLYISHKNQNGVWQKAVNLGDSVNTKFMEYCPFYDEKNEILYFTSNRYNLTPQNFSTLSQFQAYISSGKNGNSQVYEIQINLD